MGLTSSLQIGRSALTASQVALQITGNNFANAATAGYSRQIVSLASTQDARNGGFLLGRGVQVQGINRQVDQALQARLWAGVSQESHAGINLQVLSNLEATLNELSDNDLSNQFSEFFDSWSELANSPNADGARSLVVQQGRTISASMRALRRDLTSIRDGIDDQLGATVESADAILQRIADLNEAIVDAEGGGGAGGANNLRDQRGVLVTELSALLDVSVVEQASGTLDVLVGSTPVVLGGQSRGLELRRTPGGDGIDVSVHVRADGTQLDVRSGAIGGLFGQRGTIVSETIESLDEIASQLIFQVNRVHSSGYTGTPLTSIRGVQTIATADQARAFNDPANASLAALPFGPNNGGFLVTVRNEATGATETVRINVDLDGITNAGAAGFGDDTSAASLAADLDGIANLAASVNPDGTLSISANSGYSFSLAEDSSGVLATLGVNTYFTGTDAGNIGVRQALQDTPGLLAAGRTVDGQPVDNGTALAILGLRNAANTELGGVSIVAAWLDTSAKVGGETASAANRADATSLVRQSLEAQRAAVSGVSVDEESINLLTYQRQYQGAARFISVIDELTQTLLSIV